MHLPTLYTFVMPQTSFRFEPIFTYWSFDCNNTFLFTNANESTWAKTQNSKSSSNRNMVRTTLVAFVNGITKTYNLWNINENWRSYGQSKNCGLISATTVGFGQTHHAHSWHLAPCWYPNPTRTWSRPDLIPREPDPGGPFKRPVEMFEHTRRARPQPWFHAEFCHHRDLHQIDGAELAMARGNCKP